MLMIMLVSLLTANIAMYVSKLHIEFPMSDEVVKHFNVYVLTYLPQRGILLLT